MSLTNFGDPLDISLWAEVLFIKNGVFPEEFREGYSHCGKIKARIRQWSFVPLNKFEKVETLKVKAGTKDVLICKIGKYFYTLLIVAMLEID